MRIARLLISETRCPRHHRKAWCHIHLQAQYFYSSKYKLTVLKLIIYMFNFYIHFWRFRDIPESLPLGTMRPIYRTGVPLPSRHPILYIFSTNTSTEHFKHAAHSLFSPLQNAVYFIMLPFLFPVLFTVYIQDVLKFKCQIQVPKG